MIRARLLPPSLRPEIAIGDYRSIIRHGRSAIARMRLRSREKALSYARWARSRGFSSGYRTGLAQAEAECARALAQLRNEYSKAADLARQDLRLLQSLLAEHLIDQEFREDPQVLYSWIERATAILQRSRSLRLFFHPRYEKIIGRLAPHLPATLTASPALDLNEVDFRLEGETGGVEFCWRESLRAARSVSQPEDDSSQNKDEHGP